MASVGFFDISLRMVFYFSMKEFGIKLNLGNSKNLCMQVFDIERCYISRWRRRKDEQHYIQWISKRTSSHM